MILCKNIANIAGLAVALTVAGCTPSKGYHPKSDVPENHARVHKPEYRGGEVERGELEEPEQNPEIERGDPPSRVGAAWSDPRGNPMPIEVTAVIIEGSLADWCGVDSTHTHFNYDSAKLDAEARSTVAALADCFDDGPLAGHEVEVIGHTDPRGSDEYNQKLGMSRAESVAEALVRNGLSESQVEVDSHGELEAAAQPSEWPEDRRVDLRVSK